MTKENRILKKQIKILMKQVEELQQLKLGSAISNESSSHLDVIREQTETVFSDEPQTEIVKLSGNFSAMQQSENVFEQNDSHRQITFNKLHSHQAQSTKTNHMVRAH